MDITVVNKHHKVSGEYIGRGSPLGNPYFVNHKDPGSREHAIECYRRYIKERMDEQDPVILNELMRLYELAQKGPLKLLCFCAPKTCHGDVIKEILLSAKE